MANFIHIIEQPEDPIGGASGEKRMFGLRCLGKANSYQWPYAVANEVVAAHIGQTLGLKLPSVLTHKTDGGAEYALIEWQTKVPKAAAEVAEFVEHDAMAVHGAIIFDLFVANNDRAFAPQRRNIAWDSDGRLLLYDQGNACYYRNRDAVGIKAGIPRLGAVERDLASMNDMAKKMNIYFELLNSWKLVELWCERIKALPDFVLEAAVNRIPRFLARPDLTERGRLSEFLINRKIYLLDHIIARRDVMFPNLPVRTHAT